MVLICGIQLLVLVCAGILQIFNGTLTEITCSADVPFYRLMNQEGEYYNSYNDFPGLFDIEAISFPTEDSITLYINGTNRSNNVTITCRNVDVNIKLVSRRACLGRA